MVAYGVSLPAMARVKWSTARVIGVEWVYVQDDGMPWRLWLTAHMALVTFKSKVRVRRCPSDALFQWQFPDG